jgi:hypothetical protein
MLELARGVSADVPPAARHMLLLFATHARLVLEHWDTHVGVAAMARGMGYALTEDGRLTRSASVAFWRTFRKLTRDGLVRKAPCTCVQAFPHPFHVRIDEAALASRQTPRPPATELRRHGNQTVAGTGNRTAAGSGNSLVTSNSTRNSTSEHQENSTTHPPSVNGPADARVHRVSRRQHQALVEAAARRRIDAAKAIERAAAAAAAADGGIDDE